MYIVEFFQAHDMVEQWIELVISGLIATAIVGIITAVLRRTKLGRRLSETSGATIHDGVADEQMRLYNTLMALLGDSFGSFIISLDLDNYIKYNMLGHFTGKGFFTEEEEFSFIHDAYMAQLEMNIVPGQELQDRLKNITAFHVKLEKNMNVCQTSIEQMADDSYIQFQPGQKAELCEICKALLDTPNLEKIDHGLHDCASNVYMPDKLKKKLNELCERMFDILVPRTLSILSREEERFFHGKQGDQINYPFDALNNELIMDQSDLERAYSEVKTEMRKLLRIGR